MLSAFMDTHNYTNLIRNNTYFKGLGSRIDLTLTESIVSNIKSFETGLNDHHHLINTMLETTIEKKESKDNYLLEFQII